jgi:hypothetical protein
MENKKGALHGKSNKLATQWNSCTNSMQAQQTCCTLKKCWYEGEHSTYCVEMEQDIWTTSKHDTFKNPRNRKNVQR